MRVSRRRPRREVDRLAPTERLRAVEGRVEPSVVAGRWPG